jgi:hypothetical protein
MPSRKPEYEQAYDTIDISDVSYTEDVITIDLNDEDILKDFDVSTHTGIGKLPDDFVINTPNSIDAGGIFDYNNITLYNPWEEFCEYVGIDKSQDVEDFKKMCERYPALEKALEQFQNTYNLVKDDWNSENNQ